jgi:hypothetical protein
MEQPKRRGGPRTTIGKAKASGNSVTHGLRSAGVLLPGEDEGEYAAHLEGKLQSFPPIGDAETHAVGVLAERTWLQDRWHRAVRDATVDEVRARLKASPEVIRARQVDAAVVAFDTLEQALDNIDITEAGVIPDLVKLARAVVAVGREADLDVCCVAAVTVAIDELDNATDGLTAVERFGAFAVVVEDTRRNLEEMKNVVDDKVKKLERMLMLSAMPNDDDVKRLSRYGKMIDASVDQQLAILERLQGQRKARVEGQTTGESSLGRHDGPHEVRLRVIK